MSKDPNSSVKVSKACIVLFAVIMAAVMVTAPKLFSLLIEKRIDYLSGKLPYFLVSTYTACVPAAFALKAMYSLLGNIENGKVFIDENVVHIDRVSVCCIAAGFICLVSCLYYLPFVMPGVARGFVGLILKVVKNVFRQAVELQKDSDYTI